MRRVRYNVAATLDGFIAGPGGEFDGIPHDDTVDFGALFANVDTVLMGRVSYEVALSVPERPWNPGTRVYGFSTTLKPSPTHPNASILIVEVKEKMIDTIARIDNRGTPARGPWQYLGSATFNNIAGSHEAFTVAYAGAFQLEELQYLQATYRQVLNGEGLPT